MDEERPHEVKAVDIKRPGGGLEPVAWGYHLCQAELSCFQT